MISGFLLNMRLTAFLRGAKAEELSENRAVLYVSD
jgi:hypothetical protein